MLDSRFDKYHVTVYTLNVFRSRGNILEAYFFLGSDAYFNGSGRNIKRYSYGK